MQSPVLTLLCLYGVGLSLVRADFMSSCPPSCTCKWSSGLRRADCSNSDFTTIPNFHSTGSDKTVQVLIMDGNYIKELPKSIFYSAGLSDVQKIYLKNCQIEKIHGDAFSKLNILTELNLEGNQITSLEPKTFDGNNRLETIVLSRNNIPLLTDYQFPQLRNLKKLDFSSTGLEEVRTTAFNYLSNLEDIDLSGNRLKMLDHKTFLSLKKLKTLNLRDNLWHCDCQLKSFREFTVQKSLNTGMPKCSEPERLAGKSWDKTSSLEFACKPDIKVQSEMVYAESGWNITLSCHITGNPVPTMGWFLNGRVIGVGNTTRINHPGHHYHVQDKALGPGGIERNFSLEIDNVQWDDQGDYNCVAINQGGTTVKNITLTFSHPTTWAVHIDVLNVNDMRPEFEEQEYRATIKENEVPSGAILRVVAWDPDIEDRTAPQNITYFLDKTNEFADHFSIDNQGYFRVVKALDRDPPEGSPTYHIFVFAKDENGGAKGREHFVECIISLEDVNDNAPTLDMPDGLVWDENKTPGLVGELLATDKDTDANGPPFKFRIDPQASADFKAKFDVSSKNDGKYYLVTKKVFDRENQKIYSIPIEISDNQGKAGTSYLTLIIGDKNDNDMGPGSSQIFVYNYEGRAPTTQIGRVFVEDPDDWDLPYKTFSFKDASRYPDFSLDGNTGIISMREGIKLDEEIKSYHMEFMVSDESRGQDGANAVPANVTVTVKKITAEAVKKSGSIRINVSPEKFLARASSPDGRETLTKLLKGYFNASVVDVFTLLPTSDGGSDIRFAAHGSPYFAPERMELSVARRKTDLERQMDFEITMVKIDECLFERSLSDRAVCEGSCFNKLEIQNQPTAIMTNRTTFVGVTALTEARCGCPAPPRQSCDLASNGNPWRSAYSLEEQQVCQDSSCTVTGQCQCAIDRPEVYGPFCEKKSASIRYGWTTHPGLNSCGNTTIRFTFTTKQSRGLLLYQGPSPNTVVKGVTDFLALEIQEGRLKYYLNYGESTSTGVLQKIVSDGQEHRVQFSWSNSTVHLVVDDGDCLPNIQDCQLQASRPRGKAQFFNSNGPLQVGGLYFGADRLRDLASELGVARETLPIGESFAGCMRDMRVAENDGSARWISLGTPADGQQYQDGCSMEYVLAVEATGMNLNFLLIILAILAIILTAMCVLTVYRRRRIPYSDKDIDCDIRENIINYDDEGGGEGDQTGYDLSVLRLRAHENGYGVNGGGMGMDKIQPLPSSNATQVSSLPGVGCFLDETKDRVDQDPEATPYDDLRHYAYEGDGNSGGSLSSLNSGSEADQDLEFEYLHNFGPRFKKLADMYGRETDSDDSHDQDGLDNLGYYGSGDPGAGAGSATKQGAPPGSESWC